MLVYHFQKDCHSDEKRFFKTSRQKNDDGLSQEFLNFYWNHLEDRNTVQNIIFFGL